MAEDKITVEHAMSMAEEIARHAGKQRVLLLPIQTGIEHYIGPFSQALSNSGVKYRRFDLRHHRRGKGPDGYRDIITCEIYNKTGDEADRYIAEAFEYQSDDADKIREHADIRREKDRIRREELRELSKTWEPEIALIYDDDITKGYTTIGALVNVLRRMREGFLPTVDEILVAVDADHCENPDSDPMAPEKVSAAHFARVREDAEYMGPRELLRLKLPGVYQEFEETGALNKIGTYTPFDFSLDSQIDRKLAGNVKGCIRTPVRIHTIFGDDRGRDGKITLDRLYKKLHEIIPDASFESPVNVENDLDLYMNLSLSGDVVLIQLRKNKEKIRRIKAVLEDIGEDREVFSVSVLPPSVAKIDLF